MTKEFCLSNKIDNDFTLDMEDIKEFIKVLKESVEYSFGRKISEQFNEFIINKIAGDKLI